MENWGFFCEALIPECAEMSTQSNNIYEKEHHTYI